MPRRVVSALLVLAYSISAQQNGLPKNGSDAPKLPDLGEGATGYIDNAFVGTQIRIRVDGAFDDRTPDRAEFFYAKCGCFRIGGADPNAPGPGPGIVTNLRFQEYRADVEYSVMRRLSLFAEVPFRSIQPINFIPTTSSGRSFQNHAGIGDFRPGFKFALNQNPDNYITFQFRAYTPTGDASRGLGTNHYSVEPAILFQHKLTDRSALAGEIGGWLPIGGSSAIPDPSNRGFAGDVLFYGLGVNYDLTSRQSRVRVTPVLEFVGWNVRGGSVTDPNTKSGVADATGSNIANLKLGMRFTFRTHESLYFGYGRELTHVGWYRDILRLEFRHTF